LRDLDKRRERNRILNASKHNIYNPLSFGGGKKSNQKVRKNNKATKNKRWTIFLRLKRRKFNEEQKIIQIA